MRIFLTGGTGYIGSAVVDALVRGGHQVTALVRDASRSEAVTARGAQPLIADLAAPETYAARLGSFDGYIHAAVEYSPRGPDLDRKTVEAILSAPRAPGDGPDRFFIYTSGIWVLGKTTKPVAEDAPVDPIPHVAWRPPHERLVLAGHGNGMRTLVVRPGIVYGGGRGIVTDLLKDATNGLIRVIGTGRNHWPCIYDRDLADLYLRLATRPDAAGVFHANDEADERVNDIVEAVAEHMKTRPSVRHVPLEEARTKMGPYADALALDQKVRSPRARALGWTPTLRSIGGNVARLLEEFRAARA